LVIRLYYFIAGLVLILAGLIATRQHPKKWRLCSNLLYVAGMVTTFFAIFVLNDPIEGIPTDLWTLIEYLSIFLSFYGFLYKIERDMKADFKEKINDLKTDLNKTIDAMKQDIHRDIDKIENRIGRNKTSKEV